MPESDDKLRKAAGMSPEGPLQVSLLTPEATLYDGYADSVIVPGHDGEAGIRRGHCTMVSRLGAGIARITLAGSTTSTFVSGGFVQVAGNVVTILTDEAGDPGEVDRARAQRLLEESLELKASGEKQMSQKAHQIAIARARLRTANTAAEG